MQFAGDSQTEVAVVHDSHCIWVVFRGTDDDAGEWFEFDALQPRLDAGRHANLSFALRDTPSAWGPGRVHAGFYETLSDVYSDVKATVVALRSENERPVFLTGHSRGGALAVLCAYRFQAVGQVPVRGVYTFGAPRVGDAQGFVSNYTLRGLSHGMNLVNTTYRWMYAKDIGPALPFVSQQALERLLLAVIAAQGPLAATLVGGSAVVLATPETLVAAATMAAAFYTTYPLLVPPADRYSHVGLPYHYAANGNFSSSGLDRDYSTHSLESVFEGNVIGAPITNPVADHATPNYVRSTHSRLSARDRNSQSDPPYLLADDVEHPFPTGAHAADDDETDSASSRRETRGRRRGRPSG